MENLKDRHDKGLRRQPGHTTPRKTMSHAETAPQPWSHRQTVVNGLRLHYVEAGAGPPVVLLHGFPEFWYSWRHQLPAFAQAGFHALALDLPGYNESDRLADIKAYRVSNLVEILAQFIQQLSGPVALVGHD